MKPSRRRFLQWAAGAGLLVTAGCGSGSSPETPTTAGTSTPPPTLPASPTAVAIQENGLAAAVEYWAWFPSDDSLWSRSESPYDYRSDGNRWLAWPTEAGSVRCRVRGDEPPGNAGFYIDIGPIGGIDSIDIEAETVRSDGDGDQQLLVAIYFDVTEDGEYFDWETLDDRQAFAGLAGDVEAISVVPADGSIIIDETTSLDVIPPLENEIVSVEDFIAGDIEAVFASTEAALQVSVVGSGAGNVEEVIVHDVELQSAEVFTETDWPMFCYDHLNRGATSSTAGPRDSVEPRWTFETDDAVRTSPAVVDGTVYVGSDDGNLYAIDAESGEQEWVFDTDGPVEASPAVFGYMVFVASHDHRLYGLDVTGQHLWTFETGDRIRSSPNVEASANVLQQDILVTGSDDGFIYLIDPWTGELVDSHNTGAPIVSAPMLYTTGGGNWEVNVGNTAGYEIGYFPRDGGENRNFRWDPIHAAISAPKTPADVWYIANDGGRLDKWQFPNPFPDPVWTFHAEDKIRSTPVLAPPRVFVGCWDGVLYALDDQYGEIEWSVETDGKVDSSPAADDGTVFFGSTDGFVYGVDAESGDILWRFETGDEVHSSPAAVDGTVYAGSNDGSVYALSVQRQS